MFTPLALLIISSVAASLVGSFALVKRMSLGGDAMSHVALPGLGLAITFGFNPILGAAAALLIGAFLIWNIEKKSGLSSETAIGVIFSASLAIGALITPASELEEALFGGFRPVSQAAFLGYAALAAIVILFVFTQRHKLVLSLFSPDLAKSTGVKMDLLNLEFLMIFALTVLLGLRFMGALLTGSLIIIPAAIGRQLTHQFTPFIITSMVAGIASVVGGFMVAQQFGLEFGPVIVTVSAGLFVLSLLKPKK